jgi:hypothetical protein
MARYMRDGMRVPAREGGTFSGVLVQFWYLRRDLKVCSSGHRHRPANELKLVADRTAVVWELMVVVANHSIFMITSCNGDSAVQGNEALLAS